jgi:hypothetical protein
MIDVAMLVCVGIMTVSTSVLLGAVSVIPALVYVGCGVYVDCAV